MPQFSQESARPQNRRRRRQADAIVDRKRGPIRADPLGLGVAAEQDTEALDQYAERGGRSPSEWADLGPRYNN